jgi:hypothetical protein
LGAKHKRLTIVQVIRRHWEYSGKRGVTVHIDQTWPDGGVYHGEHRVESVAELDKLPKREAA